MLWLLTFIICPLGGECQHVVQADPLFAETQRACLEQSLDVLPGVAADWIVRAGRPVIVHPMCVMDDSEVGAAS